jgi:hypothetical protein
MLAALHPALGAKMPMAKRPPPDPLERATAQYEKAHDAQLMAEAALQEANEKANTSAAEVIKARWKPLMAKPYQSALTRSRLFFRDRMWPASTRLGYKQELTDMLAGTRPAGARTYLFRFALKQAQAPPQDMVVFECALRCPVAGGGYSDVISEIFMEYRGERRLFTELATQRSFMTYLWPEGANTVSTDAMRSVCNDTLLQLTTHMVDLAKYQNRHYFPPNAFVDDYNYYYTWVLGHLCALPLAGGGDVGVDGDDDDDGDGDGDGDGEDSVY